LKQSFAATATEKGMALRNVVQKGTVQT
jgi:hypothetical protein